MISKYGKQAEYSRNSEERHKHPCKICGKPIHRRITFCRQCSNRVRRGENHPLWKGGKTKNTQGYIMLWNPDHPKVWANGYVSEHIVIWETFHNRPLPEGWVIHHLNGIRDDNRPRNLQALPTMKHTLVLEAKAKRIQELEALLNQQQQLL